jgi:hypothetical protein
MVMFSPRQYRRSLDPTLTPQQERNVGVFRVVLPTVVSLVLVGVFFVAKGVVLV